MGENFSENMKKTISNAQRVALDLGHRYMGTEHLLLGMMLTEDSAAALLLSEAGAEPSTRIEAMFRRKDLAAVVHDQYMDLFGSYVIRYLYNDSGTWRLLGEDLGATVGESEVLFREKATTMLDQAEEKYKK